MAVTISGGSVTTPVVTSASTTALSTLINRWRAMLGDQLSPYLWSNEDLVEYANETIEEYCRELFILADSTTTAVCTISVVQSTATYTLHPSIVRITRARLSGQDNSIRIVDELAMEGSYPDWETSTDEDEPMVAAVNYEANRITLYPVPDDSYTLYLTVFRTPVSDLSATNLTATPEVAERYLRLIDSGVYYRAYSKNDTDAESQKNAEKWLKLNEADKEKIRRMSIHASQRPAVIAPAFGFV